MNTNYSIAVLGAGNVLEYISTSINGSDVWLPKPILSGYSMILEKGQELASFLK